MKHLYVLFLLLFLFGACTPAYIPSPVNAPFFKKKGDGQLNLLTSDQSGHTAQVSYAMSDKIFVLGSANMLDRERREYNAWSTIWSDSLRSSQEFKSFDIGLGYYKRFKKGVFEVSGGYGYGEFKVLHHSERLDEDAQYLRLFDEQWQGRYYKIFVQPGIGLTIDDIEFRGEHLYLVLGFSHRYTFVGTNESGFHFTDLYTEPAVSFKFGYKNVRFYMQSGVSIKLSYNDLDFASGKEYGHDAFLFSMGVALDFNIFHKMPKL
ncbi:hypothetical protein R9C00_19785 [Flammeovirgaceae bacterium SG7u.111]|nr:hypothetical protein [Flammeovirgaceae bacterium SG7u.132]WPO33943.1 hypothetical protein R9C00_19785 [Flammeovirgaceae bacterium SG7u.111]